MIVWIPGAIIKWWLEKKLPPPPLVDYSREWLNFRWEYFKEVGRRI